MFCNKKTKILIEIFTFAWDKEKFSLWNNVIIIFLSLSVLQKETFEYLLLVFLKNNANFDFGNALQLKIPFWLKLLLFFYAKEEFHNKIMRKSRW